MKTLLVAATMAAAVSMGAIPALAQSATAVQSGSTTSRNDAVGTMQAQNVAPTPYRIVQTAHVDSHSGAPLWHHGLPWSPANPWNYDNAGG